MCKEIRANPSRISSKSFFSLFEIFCENPLQVRAYTHFCLFQRILMFEEKMKGKGLPEGPAPKRDLSSLP